MKVAGVLGRILIVGRIRLYEAFEKRSASFAATYVKRTNPVDGGVMVVDCEAGQPNIGSYTRQVS